MSEGIKGQWGMKCEQDNCLKHVVGNKCENEKERVKKKNTE